MRDAVLEMPNLEKEHQYGAVFGKQRMGALLDHTYDLWHQEVPARGRHLAVCSGLRESSRRRNEGKSGGMYGIEHRHI